MTMQTRSQHSALARYFSSSMIHAERVNNWLVRICKFALKSQAMIIQRTHVLNGSDVRCKWLTTVSFSSQHHFVAVHWTSFLMHRDHTYDFSGSSKSERKHHSLSEPVGTLFVIELLQCQHSAINAANMQVQWQKINGLTGVCSGQFCLWSKYQRQKPIQSTKQDSATYHPHMPVWYSDGAMHYHLAHISTRPISG